MFFFKSKYDFQTRSLERDEETDRIRWRNIERALVDAITEIDKETAGLRRRWNDYMQFASNVLDESGDYEARAVEDEKAISAYEGEAKRAGERIVKLEQTRKKLQSMLESAV
jgi:predicted  nucleic acid-binding Zn-ribbon protein